MIVFYHQTKTLIDFWYRRGSNPRSLIQPSETLQVELTETHLTTISLSLGIEFFFFFFNIPFASLTLLFISTLFEYFNFSFLKIKYLFSLTLCK